MSKKKGVPFKRNVKSDGNNNRKNSRQENEIKSRHDQTKQVLMKKYDLSEADAEKVLKKIAQKNLASSKTKNNNVDSDESIKSTPQNKNDDYVQNNNILVSSSSKNQSVLDVGDSTKSVSYVSSVDSILEDIIPDYTKNVSIELDHVNLTFEIEKDKVDNIKEKVIRTIKRDKTKKFKFQVLTDVTFKIYAGEKVGIIGYNGAGKSTLLNVICGIYKPDDGVVKTNGNISPLLSLGAGFDFNYSGRKNIFLNGAVLGYEKDFLKEKESEIIEFSELHEFIDFPIKNYSSGMLAKLGFSIATIVNPDILIIDEILGVGDATFAKKSADKMRSLMDSGTTVILVSHSIPQVRELCDKAIWIDNGKVREIGDVNKVCDNYLKDAEHASNKQLANIQFR